MEISRTLIAKERLNVLLFGAGKGVSVFGTSIYSFAIGLYVLKITGSALNFATTLMLGIVPMLLIAPIAGVIADRIPKKWLVVGMDVANGLLFFALFWIAGIGQLHLSVIYISTVLLNVFTTFFGIGIEAAKPNLVRPDKWTKLNALSKFIDSSVSVLGPMIGGIVYALLDIRIFILINGISFLLSALSEWFIDYDCYTTRDNQQETTHKPTFLKDLRDGLDYFLASKSILELFFIFVSLNFLLGFSVNVPGPYIINHVLGLSSDAYGLIYAMFPLGLVIGSLTVGVLMKRYAFKQLLIVMHGVIAVVAAAIGLPVLMVGKFEMQVFTGYYAVIHFILGVAIAYVDVPIMTLLQEEIPEALRGRVLSLLMSFIKVVLPVALMLSGLLIGRVHLALLPALGSLAAMAYTCWLLVGSRPLSAAPPIES